MKSICFLLILSLIFASHTRASGCDWSQSGLEEVGNIAFKTSGTLKCIEDKPCTFSMNSYDEKDSAIILTGPENVLVGKKWLKHLDGKIKKMREYGSCYDDGEVMIIEVVINGVIFSSSQLSYDTPVWP